MSNLSNIQLILIFALYYLDKGKNVESFTQKFNAYFHMDISAQTIMYHVSKFRNVDPANNIRVDENSDYKFIWIEYIEKDRINDLKELYSSFKKGEFVHKVMMSEDGMKRECLKNIEFVINDFPQKRPEAYKDLGRNAYPRSPEVVSNAIFLAKFKCEAECNNELFYRKDGVNTYTEAHHLIPLSAQEYFEYSLDVEANVISLCPMCHRMLHYGMKTDSILKKLYEDRKKRLKSCALDITYEELLLIYR